MKKSDFEKGRKWALRKVQRIGDPAVPVETLEWREVTPVQVRVRHLDPEQSGLEEWVKPNQLIHPWANWPRVAKDERSRVRLQEWMRENPGLDRVETDAVQMVFEASGEHVWIRASGDARVDSKTLDRLADRAKVTDRPWNSPPCFTDLTGELNVPSVLLFPLAVAFAAAEPETVTRLADELEVEWSAGGYEIGQRYQHRLLREYGPRIAIVRMWASATDRSAQRQEIDRLRSLVVQAAIYLRGAGQEERAKRLERGLRGG